MWLIVGLKLNNVNMSGLATDLIHLIRKYNPFDTDFTPELF